MAASEPRSPLRLSVPLYGWDGARGERVYVDELHRRVIHQTDGGFFAIDPEDDGSAPDGFVKFADPELRSVRFSPDLSHFAYLCGTKRMGCLKAGHEDREPLILSFKWSRGDLEVLNFFWLQAPQQQKDFADLVAVTSQGIELFRVFYQQKQAQSLKAFPAQVTRCWTDPVSGMVLICTGLHTLQPFDMAAKVPQKMSKFDLVLGKNRGIEANDVAITTIYDSTYCIHADNVRGRVSFRNVSSAAQGTPEHDIVLDVAESEESAAGKLRLSRVDNLLIVHRPEQASALVFDIRHRDRVSVPAICGSCKIVTEDGSDVTVATQSNWCHVGGAMIVDDHEYKVYRLEVDMHLVLQEILTRTPDDLASVMRLLLRRCRCREHIVQTLRRALVAQTSFNDLAQGFAVLNQAYRNTIEALSKKAPKGRQATVSLQELQEAISQQSVLSEKDMVSEVFYPHFLEITGLQAAEASEGDAWRIPLPRPHVVGEDVAATPARSPYIVSVVISYLRSLLSMQILPHKILQCFVFDICMYFRQEHTLQQLLHYHVLLDSQELALRLKAVAERSGESWATQSCLDMALRLPDHGVIADLLLHTKQYLDVVPFLINQQVPEFRLSRLLEQMDTDLAARAEDPDMLEHVLSEIRMWQSEAAGESVIVPPNLIECEKWLTA